jgi:phosphonoacetaldehyde hydrolase
LVKGAFMSIRSCFDLVIFDWAGTMVDFGCQAPVAALLEAFSRRGVVLVEAEARRDMGKAKADHVRGILAQPQVAARWRDARGALPTSADANELMSDLGGLMRDQAARAARLIDGARETVEVLRRDGVWIGSSTGYTREMMAPVLREAAAQGYVPDHLVCSGETPAGRPTPLMIYKACAELGIWPLSRAVKVDDAEAGIAEGRAAGCYTVGVAASGNGVGLTQIAFDALPVTERQSRIAAARVALLAAGADIVIDTVADLMPVLQSASVTR